MDLDAQTVETHSHDTIFGFARVDVAVRHDLAVTQPLDLEGTVARPIEVQLIVSAAGQARVTDQQPYICVFVALQTQHAIRRSGNGIDIAEQQTAKVALQIYPLRVHFIDALRERLCGTSKTIQCRVEHLRTKAQQTADAPTGEEARHVLAATRVVQRQRATDGVRFQCSRFAADHQHLTVANEHIGETVLLGHNVDVHFHCKLAQQVVPCIEHVARGFVVART